MNIAIVVGTRPEVIKIAPVLKQFEKLGIDFSVCTSGQHLELLHDALTYFDIHVDFTNQIDPKLRSLAEMSVQICKGTMEFLKSNVYDAVMVHGDTQTALSAATTANLMGFQVIHVEAGLRSHNLKQPWPEEMNRRIIDLLSEYHFAPTKQAVKNLESEFGLLSNAHVVGNTVVDAFIQSSHKERSNDWPSVKLANLNLPDKFILLTHHRRESFGEPIRNVFRAVDLISKKYQIDVVFPIHPNPNVKAAYDEVLAANRFVHVISPVNYGCMVGLINLCELVISDSGGIQEEAPYAGKFTLITRDTSERMEVVEANYAQLVGTETERILQSFEKWYRGDYKFEKESVDLFGKGDASDLIAKILLETLI